jgi:hypothetical protein
MSTSAPSYHYLQRNPALRNPLTLGHKIHRRFRTIISFFVFLLAFPVTFAKAKKAWQIHLGPEFENNGQCGIVLEDGSTRLHREKVH